MSNYINFYPVLDDYLLNQISPTISYRFEYIDYLRQRKEIQFDISNHKFITFTKDQNDFNLSIYDLEVTFNVNIKNPIHLYGEKGIAPLASQLKVGLEWFSQKSKKRNIICSSTQIQDNAENQTFTFKTLFKKNTINNNIDFRVIVYLDKLITVGQNEIHLNNSEGVILGELDSKTLFLNGANSIFPIYFEESNSNLLWKIIVEYEDSTVDKFIDSVKLIFNKRHKDFVYVDNNNKLFNKSFAIEIMSHAISIILLRFKDDGCIENLNSEVLEGTIAHYLKYYKDIIGIDFTSAVSISTTFREYLNKGY